MSVETHPIRCIDIMLYINNCILVMVVEKYYLSNEKMWPQGRLHKKEKLINKGEYIFVRKTLLIRASQLLNISSPHPHLHIGLVCLLLKKFENISR